MKTAVEVKHLYKSFKLSHKQRKLEDTESKTKIAVNNLSFSVYEGEIFALLGANGAGKTTTLRIISTLIKADKGDCRIKGMDVREEAAAVRSQLAFLIADLKLDNFFTPNYLFDFFARLHGLAPSEIARSKHKLFSVLGVDKFAEVKVGKLSTGMRQKVAIAVALAHDPDIIIFDEPTNGLDIVAVGALRDFLLLLKREGKTVIISTHILDFVCKIADRAGIIIDGEMKLCGEVKELTRTKALEDVFFELYQGEKQ